MIVLMPSAIMVSGAGYDFSLALLHPKTPSPCSHRKKVIKKRNTIRSLKLHPTNPSMPPLVLLLHVGQPDRDVATLSDVPHPRQRRVLQLLNQSQQTYPFRQQYQHKREKLTFGSIILRYLT